MTCQVHLSNQCQKVASCKAIVRSLAIDDSKSNSLQTRLNHQKASTPIWIRTRNLRFRRPMLYPIELWVQTASRKLIGNDPRFLAPTSPILAHFPNFLKPFHTHPEEIQLIVPTRTLYLRSTLRQFVPSHRRHSRRIAILLDPSLAIPHLSPPTKRFFSPRKLRN